ncbi:mucin-5AC-like isoform X5 [Eriocheir sinensis]|uniref:mucin-5AC-like isoform X5 n=1 Tax=Eriocheir sinensis TaxID=95602 RepID=UPI0021CA16E7|nr:mucin-5AC-like isoform X5 [Eriocheir sinensis]
MDGPPHPEGGGGGGSEEGGGDGGGGGGGAKAVITSTPATTTSSSSSSSSSILSSTSSLISSFFRPSSSSSSSTPSTSSVSSTTSSSSSTSSSPIIISSPSSSSPIIISSPSSSSIASSASSTSSQVLMTSDGHLVFPLPILNPSLDSLTAPTYIPSSTLTYVPVSSPSPTPQPPRPTTPRRPTPRRPAPQPPTRPGPPVTPVPITTSSADRSGSSTPTQEQPTPAHTYMPTPTASTTSIDSSLSTPASSVGVGRGALSLRLIDEDEDSDFDSRCDSFEDRLVFPPRPAYTTTTTPMSPPSPPAHVRTRANTQPTHAPAHVSCHVPGHVLTHAPAPCTHDAPHATAPMSPTTHAHAPIAPTTHAPLALNHPLPHRPPPLHCPPPPHYVPPPPEAQWWGDARGNGLAHSASDPMVRPPLWQPPEAPQQQGAREGPAAPRLARSDSVVAVPEDLLTPKPSLAGAAAAALVAAALMPGAAMMLHAAFRLVFGTLFPAYYSYKAVKTKNVKEYVKWMMYWIVFAFFTCLETLTDVFLSFWFPFYYELKILVVLWLLSPATRGSSILYRKFVHPWLTRREDDIDNCIAQAKEQGYSAVLSLGSKGVNYATTVIMQTAIKGGGGIMNQLKRSYSSGELIGADGDMNRNIKPLPPHLHDNDYDDPTAHHHLQHHHLPRQPPPPGAYDSEPRVRAESDAAYKPRGSSASRVVRSNKTRSADVTDYYQDSQDDGNGSSIARRRSPRSQDPARSQPTLHFQEPPPREPQRKRGKSENRPRPKSMVSADYSDEDSEVDVWWQW